MYECWSSILLLLLFKGKGLALWLVYVGFQRGDFGFESRCWLSDFLYLEASYSLLSGDSFQLIIKPLLNYLIA